MNRMMICGYCRINPNGILTLLMILFFFPAFSQNQMVMKEYKEKTFVEIAKDIEGDHTVNIFYKPEDISERKLSFNWNSISVEKAIQTLAEEMGLSSLKYSATSFVLMKSQIDKNAISNYYENIQKQADEKSNITTNVIHLGEATKLASNGLATISGKVVDESTNEAIIGATIFLSKDKGTSSNYDGEYSLSARPGLYEIKAQYSGFQDYLATLDVLSSGNFNISMKRETVNLDEVTITAIAKNAAVQEVQTSVARIDIKSIDKIPTLLGERDIVKAVLLNPGVSTIGEGSTGYNVRGGNVDQNLVLQDDAILYNSSHALGFFSTFNSDMIRDASLYKGNVPASFGGRLASVLEVNMKEGNVETQRIKGSINPVSATLTADGPISKNTSFIVGARSTFSDYIFGLFSNPDLKKSKASFYDINAKLSYKKGKNKLALSAYRSSDNFRFANKFGFDYSTSIVQASWNRIFSNSLSNKIGIVYSTYNSNQNDFTTGTSSILSSEITNMRLVQKLLWSGKESKFEAGLNAIFHDVLPGSIKPLEDNSVQPAIRLQNEKALESAIFAAYEFRPMKGLEFSLGSRLNYYASLGPQEVYEYYSGVALSDSIISSSIKDGIIKSYLRAEPHVSIKLSLAKTASLKLGYAKTTQFLNQIFNADTPTPTNQWQLSNSYLKPNVADNFSAGIFKNLSNDNWEVSLEVYHRKISQLYDYRDFAKLIVNPHIETELISGIGKASGVEVSVKKNAGNFNGWVSYTYANTAQKIEGINRGNWYNANYDKPHNFSFILNFQPQIRHTLTFNFNYSTGRPTTPPVSSYLSPDNIYIPIYSARNQVRIPDYHRLDISYNIARTNNQAAKVITSWTFSIYNVYGRKNPFSLYYTRGYQNLPQANQLSVVGTAIPAIRFNIEFI